MGALCKQVSVEDKGRIWIWAITWKEKGVGKRGECLVGRKVDWVSL